MPSLYGKKQKPMPEYLADENEFKWYKYCVDNNIRISPSAVGAGTPTRWILVLDLNGKIVNGPDQLAKNEVWVKMYEYYMYYYKKSNQ